MEYHPLQRGIHFVSLANALGPVEYFLDTRYYTQYDTLQEFFESSIGGQAIFEPLAKGKSLVRGEEVFFPC